MKWTMEFYFHYWDWIIGLSDYWIYYCSLLYASYVTLFLLKTKILLEIWT